MSRSVGRFALWLAVWFAGLWIGGAIVAVVLGLAIGIPRGAAIALILAVPWSIYALRRAWRALSVAAGEEAGGRADPAPHDI